jgi:hypothetical protein
MAYHRIGTPNRRTPIERPSLTPIEEAAQWTAWGAYLEGQGQDNVARVAYGEALRVQPSPAVALAAGRTSERSGDVTAAVSYYAAILGSPAPEKGEIQEGGLEDEAPSRRGALDETARLRVVRTAENTAEKPAL